jgi:hypothetical protein
MQNLNLFSKITALATVAMLFSLSGCAAKYHTIRKSQGGENQNSKEGDDAQPKGQAPSAQVEVILDGKLVVKVKAGSKFVIRPSESTMDPDDKDIKDCRNPGITNAAYTPGQDGEKIASRSANGCETLEVEHTFDLPGMYEISMTVTSNENETASSKMILQVTPADSTDDLTEGGFVVTANPLISEVGENIKFIGDCTGGTKISWDYRDQTSGTGSETLKAYNTPGQYVVVAKCETDKNETLTGQVTVVVVPKKTTADGPTTEQEPEQPKDEGDKPGDKPITPTTKPVDPTDKPTTPVETPAKPTVPTTPATPDNDDDKPGNHPGKPGQNPGQNPGQTVFQG